MRTHALTITIAALLLAGCSSSSDEPDIRSGQDVADMVGCTGFTNDSEEVFLTEGGTCQLDGEDVSIAYFADNDARDSYIEMGADFGGNYLFGDGWAIDAPPAVLDAIEKEHGGERP